MPKLLYNGTMLLLGHLGVTVGLAWFGQGLVAKWRNVARLGRGASRAERAHALRPGDCPSEPKSTHRVLLDYRLVLLGSMLPDVIDKPIGIFLLGNVFSNGRIFAHSALFTLALLVAGAALYRRSFGPRLATLGYGSFMHLILDGMWANPQTLLWPLQGWAFAKADISHWLWKILLALTHDSRAYISEALGGAILVAFLLAHVQRKRIWRWLKTGEI